LVGVTSKVGRAGGRARVVEDDELALVAALSPFALEHAAAATHNATSTSRAVGRDDTMCTSAIPVEVRSARVVGAMRRTHPDALNIDAGS
jgi:hypothetical protein